MIELPTNSHVIRGLVIHVSVFQNSPLLLVCVRAHEEPIEGRVLLGSTVSGWLSFFVFYWGKAAFGWFG